ncbi:MAG: type II toxin-antitoxin system Phd/YefM family antitoxin [Oligoflexia bacterium]|nr:type II toxin-antitoxin system Phd/YefM family antitoxin [Oligoflexia bacterium]
MFRSQRIITATELRKNFDRLAREVVETEEPYLIMQKHGRKVVLMDSLTFEDMVHMIGEMERQRQIPVPSSER